MRARDLTGAEQISPPAQSGRACRLYRVPGSEPLALSRHAAPTMHDDPVSAAMLTAAALGCARDRSMPARGPRCSRRPPSGSPARGGGRPGPYPAPLMLAPRLRRCHQSEGGIAVPKRHGQNRHTGSGLRGTPTQRPDLISSDLYLHEIATKGGASAVLRVRRQAQGSSGAPLGLRRRQGRTDVHLRTQWRDVRVAGQLLRHARRASISPPAARPAPGGSGSRDRPTAERRRDRAAASACHTQLSHARDGVVSDMRAGGDVRRLSRARAGRTPTRCGPIGTRRPGRDCQPGAVHSASTRSTSAAPVTAPTGT